MNIKFWPVISEQSADVCFPSTSNYIRQKTIIDSQLNLKPGKRTYLAKNNSKIDLLTVMNMAIN